MMDDPSLPTLEQPGTKLSDKEIAHLQALAKQMGLEITEQQALACYGQTHSPAQQPLSDQELACVTGGSNPASTPAGNYDNAGYFLPRLDTPCEYWICSGCGGSKQINWYGETVCARCELWAACGHRCQWYQNPVCTNPHKRKYE